MENKFTIHEQKILDLIFKYPSQFYSAREIARITGLSHPTVLKALQKYNKLDITKKELQKNKSGIGGNVFWKADTSAETYKLFKKLANLRQIYYSNLIENIASETSPNVIVLFGSYSRGEDTEESDIDLFVQSKEKKLHLKEFEKKLGRKINITFEIDIHKIKKEFLNNLINGIVLYGYLEVLK